MTKKLLIAAILITAVWTQIPAGYRTVRATVERQQNRIAVTDHAGRGMLFYRGETEVAEWLASRPEGWEADLQSVVRASLRGDGVLPSFMPTNFRLFEPRVTKGIGTLSINNIWSFGSTNVAAATTLQINEGFVFGTSGKALVVAFNSPVTQTSATLAGNFYCTAESGTPNESVMDIYASAGAGEDPQRPDTGGSPLATSSNVDPSACGTPKWLTYEIASISLTRGAWYFLIIRNTEADPATDNFTITTRSTAAGYGSLVDISRSCTTADGITTDPTCASNQLATGVLKFGDGTVWGNPYVVSAVSANNTNYRGNRYTFTEDVVVSGIKAAGTIAIATTLEVYKGGVQQTTVTLDAAALGNQMTAFFAPTTFEGGADVDIVLKPGSNSTHGTSVQMGNSPPADVQAAAGHVTYVNGATPGSFTETANQFIPWALILDNNPAISGGGGGGIIGQ